MPLGASLFYSSADPCAICIAFHDTVGEPVEWVFARELLSTGIQKREGPGDVTVWPSAGPEGAASVLNIELSSPFGRAHFETSASRTSDFPRRTYQIVPAGEEGAHLDVDAALNDLLF